MKLTAQARGALEKQSAYEKRGDINEPKPSIDPEIAANLIRAGLLFHVNAAFGGYNTLTARGYKAIAEATTGGEHGK